MSTPTPVAAIGQAVAAWVSQLDSGNKYMSDGPEYANFKLIFTDAKREHPR